MHPFHSPGSSSFPLRHSAMILCSFLPGLVSSVLAWWVWSPNDHREAASHPIGFWSVISQCRYATPPSLQAPVSWEYTADWPPDSVSDQLQDPQTGYPQPWSNYTANINYLLSHFVEGTKISLDPECSSLLQLTGFTRHSVPAWEFNLIASMLWPDKLKILDMTSDLNPGPPKMPSSQAQLHCTQYALQLSEYTLAHWITESG